MYICTQEFSYIHVDSIRGGSIYMFTYYIKSIFIY